MMSSCSFLTRSVLFKHALTVSVTDSRPGHACVLVCGVPSPHPPLCSPLTDLQNHLLSLTFSSIQDIELNNDGRSSSLCVVGLQCLEIWGTVIMQIRWHLIGSGYAVSIGYYISEELRWHTLMPFRVFSCLPVEFFHF